MDIRKLILYHGSNREFDEYDLKYAKPFKDFGKGFYLTTNYAQAQKWAQNKSLQVDSKYAFIYMYQICGEVPETLKVLELLQYDKYWLDFIMKCRMERFEPIEDIIYDRMADNQYREISNVLRQYAKQKVSDEQAIKKIRWSKVDADQYCFKTDRALEILKRKHTMIQYRDSRYGWKQVELK